MSTLGSPFMLATLTAILCPLALGLACLLCACLSSGFGPRRRASLTPRAAFGLMAMLCFGLSLNAFLSIGG